MMEGPTPERITQAEFSRLMDVSKKTVTKWKKQGKIVMDGDLVDVAASRAALDKFTGARGAIRVTQGILEGVTGNDNGFVASPAGNDDDSEEALRFAAGEMFSGSGYANKAEAELAKDTWMARMKQLQYERAAGLVVDVTHVAKLVGESLARVRTRLLSIPGERAAEIHRAKTAAEVQDALMAAIVEALEELIRPDDFEAPGAA